MSVLEAWIPARIDVTTHTDHTSAPVSARDSNSLMMDSHVKVGLTEVWRYNLGDEFRHSAHYFGY